ncbi:MAG TPA: XrtA system polysaccharide chain length determinant [Steroidobacteraceae bacterium]|nr:XrtA system polysaccharide chain length determinant [Steroidobacteraceae bacterium]
MQELFEQILRELRSAWRFRWIALASAWAIAITGWGIVLSMPDIYEAKAKVYVDTETVLKPLLSGLAVNTDMTSQVNMMSAVLMSRPNIEKIVRDTDLYLRAKTPEDTERLLASLPAQVSLGGGRDSTYVIAYRDADPQMAHRVVRRFLDTFVEDSLGVKRDDSAGAQRFLQQQIREYEQKLRAAEDRLADFKKQNVGLMPSERGDYYTRLPTEINLLEELRAKYRATEDKRAELDRQLKGEEPTFGLTGASGPTGPNDALIAQYKAQLETLLVQYTEKHPQVIAVRETIAKLEEENRKAVASGQRGPATAIDPNTAALRKLDINPVYQTMKISLSQTELELVELKNKIRDQQALVSDLRSKVNTIPEVEAQLARLNRDYDVNHQQYTALLQRLESARLSDEAEQSSEHVKFRVIEPPLVPLNPVAPNRPLLLTVALLVALVGGGALALLLHQLNPVFSTRTTLQEQLGLPVLGTLSLVLSQLQQKELRLQPAYYAIGVALLILVFAGTMMWAPAAAAMWR